MSDTYNDRQDSKIYGSRLIIFRRKGAESGVFSFRAKIDGQVGYIRRSCDTTDPTEAMFVAHSEYDKLKVRALSGFALTELTVDKFFHDWIERKKHNFTETRALWKKGVYERYISGFLGKRNISELTKKVCDGYWEYRLNFWSSKEGLKRLELNHLRIGAKSFSSHNVAKVPSFATLKAEASLLNEFLRAATDEGHLGRSIKISAQDAVAKNERGDGFRDTFTDIEYRVLTRNLFSYSQCKGKFADKGLHNLHKFQRLMLRTFVLLSSSTGMRVGELKQLVWDDLDFRTDDSGKKILVVSVRGETSKVRRGRTAVAHSSHIVSVMDEYRNASKYTGPNDLIFFSEHKGVGVTEVDLSVSFKNFLKRCEYEGRPEGLRMSNDGKPRTLYSLRHFYAISRLKQNVDVYQLATNMGTGVDQIRNHYARHISGDAFIKELTKFQSKEGERVKSSAIRKLVEMVESGVLDEESALDAFRKVAAARNH
jgi:integrase